MFSKVWVDITYPFKNLNGCTDDIWDIIPCQLVQWVWLLINYGIKVNTC